MGCSGGDAYGGDRRQEMSLHEYTAWWRQHKAGGGGRLLYLKDWHFASEFPGYKVCGTPWPGNAGWMGSYPLHAASLIIHQAEHYTADKAAVEIRSLG